MEHMNYNDISWEYLLIVVIISVMLCVIGLRKR